MRIFIEINIFILRIFRSSGAITGILIGIFLFILIVIGVCVWLFCCYRKRPDSKLAAGGARESTNVACVYNQGEVALRF